MSARRVGRGRRFAAVPLGARWALLLGFTVASCGEPVAGNGHDTTNEVKVAASADALMGSDQLSLPPVQHRNALLPVSQSSILLTPDGRVGVVVDPSLTSVRVGVLGDPRASVTQGVPAFAAPLWEHAVQTSISPNIETLPDGSTPALFQNSGGGALALDPRFSPSGKPFPTKNAADCSNALASNLDAFVDVTGPVDCYRLIHFQPFYSNFVHMYQATLSVAVDARRPSTITGVTSRSATPTVQYAAYTSRFERTKRAADPNVPFWALETTATGDGRLLISEGGRWTFNERPWIANGWTAQRGFHQFYDTVRTDVDGLRHICRHPAAGRLTCTASEEEPFARVYPIAAQPIYLADGTRPTSLPCGYPWISPEGTDIFCRPPPDSSGLELRQGFESSTGMHFFSFGQHTGWNLRRLDGGPNARRFNPDQLTWRGDIGLVPENTGNQRPFSLLFLNTSTGFWAENRQSPETSLPILRQFPVFQFLVQANSLTPGSATRTEYAQQGMLQPNSVNSVMQYFETSFACGVSPHCQLHLQMNELRYDVAAEASSQGVTLKALPVVHDASNNTDFFDSAGAPLAAIHPYVGQLTKSARFVGELYGASADYRYTSGYRGTAVSLGADGAVSVARNAIADAARCRRNKGCLAGEVYDTGFTSELAFLPLFDPASGNVHLGSQHGLWSLTLQKGKLQATVTYTNRNGSSARVTLTDTLTAPFSSVAATMSDQARLWTHVALRVSTADRHIGVYVNGSPRLGLMLPAGARLSAAALADGEIVRVGPAGTCGGCPSSDALLVDEVLVHKTPLPPETIAASAGAYAGRADFLTPASARSLLAGYFSVSNPNRLSLAADGFPAFVKPEDLRIPARFGQFLGPGGDAKFRQLVAAGNALFLSPVLSTGSAGVSQLQSGTNLPLSCATCHDPARAFTDGRTTALGLGPLNLNSPTIINRAFGTNQFFARRSSDLIDQALRPVLDTRELNGDLTQILARINTEAAQASIRNALFSAFGAAPVTSEQLALALTAYQLVQLSVDSLAEAVLASGKSVTDLQGNLVRSELVAKGKALFEGKARCSACHTGPNLSDELPHDTGVTVDVLGAFKTPTLWDIARTAPYFHDGSRATLRSVLDFYNAGGSDPNLPAATASGGLRSIDPEMRPLGLNERELTALETYLRSLQNANPLVSAGLEGIVYSAHGPIPGLHCISIVESADPAWRDNYLCSAIDHGFAFSSAGPIANMKCVQLTELGEPPSTTWNDNYLCVPNASSLNLRWIDSGMLPPGKVCVHVHEPTDPHDPYWADNHLCYDAPLRVEFSSAGPIGGMNCVQWLETSDTLAGWDDNYLCTNKRIGMAWGMQGPVAGKRCTQIVEGAEPTGTGWGDNFLCVDHSADALFSWSMAGPLAGQSCVLVNEPNDPHAWGDNYLCWREQPLDLQFTTAGPLPGKSCIEIFESADAAHTWLDNYLCGNRDIGLRWSSAGAIAGLQCVQVTEPLEPASATWNDNYLCAPFGSLRMQWSYAGALPNQTCVSFNESADPYGWADNYLCY